MTSGPMMNSSLLLTFSKMAAKIFICEMEMKNDYSLASCLVQKLELHVEKFFKVCRENQKL